MEDGTPGTIRYWSNYGNPYMWTGQRYDAETRLYHFLCRSYSPELGRWLQRDPLGYVDGISLYEYAASNPTCWGDAFGLAKGDRWYGLEKMPYFREFKDYWHMELKPGYGRDGTEKDMWDEYHRWMDDGRPGAGDSKGGHRRPGRGRGRGGGRGARAIGGAAILLGIITEMASALEHVADSGIFQRLLAAIKRGDLNAADDLARKLEKELIAAGHGHAGMNWWKKWRNYILPALSKKLNELKRRGLWDGGDPGADDNDGVPGGSVGPLTPLTPPTPIEPIKPKRIHPRTLPSRPFVPGQRVEPSDGMIPKRPSAAPFRPSKVRPAEWEC